MTTAPRPPVTSKEAGSEATLEPDAERDIRPVVERPRTGISGTAIAILAGVAALGLFGMLEARRQKVTAPAAAPMQSEIAGSAAPPPLYLPPPTVALPAPFATITPVPAPLPAAPTPPRVAPEAVRVITSYPIIPTVQTPAPPAQTRSSGGSPLILDISAPGAPAGDPQEQSERRGAGERTGGLPTTRVRASMFANRATTVPQGTLIPAVLETAFDSTSPGFARALVQRDIHGFDGTHVLIPRGSRLIGEYGADTARGQKRAVILWSRLIRPDGVTIAIGSPAADPEGRGGVKADVDTHFLERFSGAILQSALDVGVALAARNSRSPVIVALPGSTTGVAGSVNTRANDIAPTLRVPAGRSVSVFVARDLDFTQAEARR